jgi:hypothetical protein
MDLVFDPRPMPDDLIAAANKPTHPLGSRIRRPDLRQISSRILFMQAFDCIRNQYEDSSANAHLRSSRTRRMAPQTQDQDANRAAMCRNRRHLFWALMASGQIVSNN